MTGTNGAADPARNRGSRITAGSFFTATGDAGSIDIRAGRIELDDGARITASTSGIGAGGSVTIDASGPITLAGARGDGSGSAIKASTEVEAEEAGEVDAPRIGNAGRVSIRAPSLVLADGAEIVGNTALAGTGGEVLIDVGELRIGHARIATESTAAGADAGAAGAVSVIVADALVLEDGGRISASTIDGRGGSVTLRSDRILIGGTGSVSAATTGAGQGGDIALAARSIDLRDGGTVSASATGAGNAGRLTLTADDTLAIGAGSIVTSADHSAGGDIFVEAGRQVMLTDAIISAEAGGVTEAADGGNIVIDPDFVILDASDVIARANAGNGGNITIRAGFVVGSADSRIDASSTSGIDGDVLIDSPNEITGSVLPLETPAPASDPVEIRPCVPRLAGERSTLTVESRMAPAAGGRDAFLPSPGETAAGIEGRSTASLSAAPCPDG